jgi:carotenoid cleavage dioxygenase-like enzyme
MRRTGQIIRRREFLHLASGLSLAALRCGGETESEAPLEQPPPPCTKDWWMCGNYAPVAESEAENLQVIGALPPELDGLYLRNGPNSAHGDTSHWFLGDGMVHGVRLSAGSALWYRARFIQTEPFKDGAGGGSGPPTLTGHQANTSVVHHAGRLLCLEEVGLPYEIRTEDLSTVGPWDFAGALADPMTAHPKIDPATGEMLFFGYGLFTPTAAYHAVDSSGTLTKSEIIEMPAPVMMHDFQITPTHVVFLDLPVLFDLDLAISGDSLPFVWNADNGARIGVMPRAGTAADVEWFEIEPCYVFHTFNAFHDPADPNRILLDCVRYPDMWVGESTNFNTSPELWRYSVKLGTGMVDAEVLDDHRIEMPRIDLRRQGQPYRYGWANLFDAPEGGAIRQTETLVKIDHQTGSLSEVAAPDGLHLDEVTFVPADGAAGEDEGWLVCYGYQPATDRSQLLVLDAQELGVVARVELPSRVPHGFHGIWVPA